MSLARVNLLQVVLVVTAMTAVTGFTIPFTCLRSSYFVPKNLSPYNSPLLRPSCSSLSPPRRLLASSRPPPALSPLHSSPPPWPFLLLSSAAILISYADRANLATCILPMAQELDWPLSAQGLVLSSFFVGYGLTGLLGGYLADRYGGSRVLQAGIFLWSTFTLLMPFFAQAGIITAVLARFFLGLGEGVAFPAIHAMIPLRVPPDSRSLAVSLITAASYLGAVFAFALSPLLIETAGWPSVFYFFGALPLLWFPLWWLYGGGETAKEDADGGFGAADGKGEERTVGRMVKENDTLQKVYLPDALVPYPPATSSTYPSSLPPSSSSGLSWSEAKYLLGRKEVQAILVAQYTQSWGIYGLLSWLPSYYNKTFNVDVSNLAAFTLAPYLLQALVGVSSGYLADSLIAAGWRVKRVRQLLQSAGTLLPALFLLLATSTYTTTAASSSPSLAFSFLYVTVGAGFSAFTLSGVSCSHLDVCPRHAGVVFAAGNTLATIGGLFSVPVASLLLEKTGNFDAVFALFAAHYLVGAVVYTAWIGEEDVLLGWEGERESEEGKNEGEE